MHIHVHLANLHPASQRTVAHYRTAVHDSDFFVRGHRVWGGEGRREQGGEGGREGGENSRKERDRDGE